MFKIAGAVTGLLLLVGGVVTTVPAVGDAIQSVTDQTGVASAVTSVTDALSAAVQDAGGIDQIKADRAAHQAEVNAGIAGPGRHSRSGARRIGLPRGDAPSGMPGRAVGSEHHVEPGRRRSALLRRVDATTEPPPPRSKVSKRGRRSIRTLKQQGKRK